MIFGCFDDRAESSRHVLAPTVEPAVPGEVPSGERLPRTSVSEHHEP
jgi:hypothetical protein